MNNICFETILIHITTEEIIMYIKKKMEGFTRGDDKTGCDVEPFERFDFLLTVMFVSSEEEW